MGRLAACLALAALLAGLLPAPAEAIFERGPRRCDPTDNDIEEATRVIGEIDAMERAIIEALRLQTGQLAGYEAQGAAAVTQALDAQTKLQSQIAREKLETEALIAHRPSETACDTVTGAAGLGGARAGEATALEAAVTAEAGRVVLDRAVTSGSSTTDANWRFDAVTGTWCNGERSGQGACTGPSELHAADIRAGSLYDVTTFSDQRALHAAVEHARNVTAPVVFDPPPLAAATAPEERRRILLARSADARTALAVDYFARQRAIRAPAVDLGAWAAAMGPEGARDPGEPVSRYELLEILASSRFDDPDWFVSLQAMNGDAVLREIASLLAVSLIVDWERYQLEERRGAIAAARLAIDTEATRRLPGLASSVN